ncbi:hypothetical protein HK1_00830 [Tepidibacillus sp. HK-1]|nr:hypothetical protein HK1_00830 [Tepidibacillus sp. HK-1]
MMRKYFRNQKGVTLIELLAVIMILSVIILAISSVQLYFLKSHKEINEGSFKNDESAFFIQWFSNQVRDASDITIQTDFLGNAISVTITKNIEPSISIEYDQVTKKIKMKDSELTLLKDVSSFQVVKRIQGNRIGVNLSIEFLNQNQSAPIEITIFSQVDDKKN